jgi:hypothetical protein
MNEKTLVTMSEAVTELQSADLRSPKVQRKFAETKHLFGEKRLLITDSDIKYNTSSAALANASKLEVLETRLNTIESKLVPTPSATPTPVPVDTTVRDAARAEAEADIHACSTGVELLSVGSTDMEFERVSGLCKTSDISRKMFKERYPTASPLDDISTQTSKLESLKSDAASRKAAIESCRDASIATADSDEDFNAATRICTTSEGTVTDTDGKILLKSFKDDISSRQSLHRRAQETASETRQLAFHDEHFKMTPISTGFDMPLLRVKVIKALDQGYDPQKVIDSLRKLEATVPSQTVASETSVTTKLRESDKEYIRYMIEIVKARLPTDFGRGVRSAVSFLDYKKGSPEFGGRKTRKSKSKSKSRKKSRSRSSKRKMTTQLHRQLMREAPKRRKSPSRSRTPQKKYRSPRSRSRSHKRYARR